MNILEFKRKFIDYYSILESDFKDTLKYVNPEEDNYSTYSDIYIRQLLTIGSEVDVVKKVLAKIYEPKFDEKKFKKSTKDIILENFPEIKKVRVMFKPTRVILSPWDCDEVPMWWTVYNEIKHNRQDIASKIDKSTNKKYYQYANLENTLLALAGLNSLLLIAYRELALEKKERVFVPNIITMFRIDNSFWKGISYGDGIVYMDGDIFLGDDD